MVTPNNNIAVAADPECPVCIQRAERDASLAQYHLDRAQRVRLDRAARESYAPNADSETYDGPLGDDGEPLPSCFSVWQTARRKALAPVAAPALAPDLAISLYQASKMTNAAAAAPLDSADASGIRQILARIEADVRAIRERIESETRVSSEVPT